jgi:hypothetical protein
LEHTANPKDNKTYYVDFSAEGSKSSMLAKVDYSTGTKNVSVIGYYDSLKDEATHKYHEQMKSGLEKNFIIKHQFNINEMQAHCLIKLEGSAEKINIHNLFHTVEEYFEPSQLKSPSKDANLDTMNEVQHYISFGVNGTSSSVFAELDYSTGTKKVKMLGYYDEAEDKSSEGYHYNIETFQDSDDLIHHDFTHAELYEHALKSQNKTLDDMDVSDIAILINNYFELDQLVKKQNEASPNQPMRQSLITLVKKVNVINNANTALKNNKPK